MSNFTATAKNNLRTMKLNRVTLALTGPSAALEGPFQSYYTYHTLPHIRIALLVGMLMYGGFGILDALLLPNHKHFAWLVRYAFVCPMILAVSGATFVPSLQRILQPVMCLLVALGGLGIVLIIVAAPPPANYYYYAGLVLVFIFGYSFIYLRFLWASVSGWIIVILYELAAFLTGTPDAVLISNNFFFISANIACMLVGYTIEYANRRNFFLMHLLAEEQQKIKEINEQLELRVAARTNELAISNQRLTKEVKERILAEQERQRLQIQLKQAEKMEALGNLAAGVAHDLNNILVGLVGYPDLVLMKIPEDDPLHEEVVQIKNSGVRAAAMVQDLLGMARLGITEKKVVNLNQILNDYLQSPEFQGLQQNHRNVTITANLASDLLNIRAAIIQMTKAVMNLVTNACEAIFTEGAVQIGTSNRYLEEPYPGLETIPAGEYAVLTVQDNGIGLDEEARQHIFEPFYTKKWLGRSGTGLGMTVVWHTVKEVGGFIDIRRPEGRGTMIELYLPVTREEIPSTPPKLPIDDYRGTERVLVVDDIAEQRRIAAGILTKLGYKVVTVAGGEEAVAWIEQHEVDIVVLDMIMDPGIDGCETYRRLAEWNPDLKAIIVSGFSESERVREAQRLGAGRYLSKPYTLEGLALAIRAELNDRSVD
ncbi:MAG: two-component system, cell cycle sensor histidine kinase and response regulator CckA [Thermodesulfobacteriota bacterium]|nr:two-component system, cell cycle sensor histidine kinase and response regulator CckA [Thermodesulfobacteriota bacterium]